MAHGSFSPHSFFTRANGELLEQFAKKHGVAFTHDDKEKSEKTAEKFFYAIESLPEDKRAEVWGVLFEIDDMATEQAGDCLFEMAQDEDISIPQAQIDTLTTHQSRSLFFKLNYPEIFDASIEDVRLDNLSGWRRYPLIARLSKDVIQAKPSFERELKKYYQKEYKGKHCKIIHSQRENRLYFVAFVEGMYKNDLAFEGKQGQLNRHKARKPVLEAFFVYRPESGILEIKAKGGEKKAQALQEMFSECALGKLVEFDKDVVAFDFDKFTRLDKLVFTPDETIDIVQLKALRLVHRNLKDQFLVQIGNRSEYGAEPMIRALGAMAQRLYEFSVNQAVIFVRFKKLQHETRAKKVTFQLTYPNRHNLKERPQDIKVRELLKHWELDLL